MKKTLLLSVILLITFESERLEAKELSTPIIENIKTTSSVVQSYTFVLTHLLGKKLKTSAYFKVGNMKKWTLDFRNGDKIIYTIVGKSGSNPLCGLSAKDNKGDYCTICVTPKPGKRVVIEITYGSRNFKYSGYISR